MDVPVRPLKLQALFVLDCVLQPGAKISGLRRPSAVGPRPPLQKES
jgi:hypothetical protein